MCLLQTTVYEFTVRVKHGKFFSTQQLQARDQNQRDYVALHSLTCPSLLLLTPSAALNEFDPVLPRQFHTFVYIQAANYTPHIYANLHFVEIHTLSGKRRGWQNRWEIPRSSLAIFEILFSGFGADFTLPPNKISISTIGFESAEMDWFICKKEIFGICPLINPSGWLCPVITVRFC